MSTKDGKGLPLTLGEARLVADMIKNNTNDMIDRQYWSWIIEELCNMVEDKDNEIRELKHTAKLLDDDTDTLLDYANIPSI